MAKKPQRDIFLSAFASLWFVTSCAQGTAAKEGLIVHEDTSTNLDSDEDTGPGLGSDSGIQDTLDGVDEPPTGAETGIDSDSLSSDTQANNDTAAGSDSTTSDEDSDSVPKAIAVIDETEPVFDFDGDGCLPSVGYDDKGEQNGGLSPTGSITGGCRDDNFLDSSHTLHRYACMTSSGSKYCCHFYALYFEKDQATVFGGGHRHDWEHAAVWTKDGVVTHGSASAHGDLDTTEASSLEFQGSHLKIVYHKEGLLTHALRFANDNEPAENPYGKFVTPRIESWYELTAEGLSNEQMRERLNTFDYGSATIPLKDSNFLENVNEFRPAEYPVFTLESVEASNPFP